MNRPCRSRLSSVRPNHGSAAASAESASAATQFAARIATSIVVVQLTPSSTGLASIQLSSWAPTSSTCPVAASKGRCWKRDSSHGTLTSEPSSYATRSSEL